MNMMWNTYMRLDGRVLMQAPGAGDQIGDRSTHRRWEDHQLHLVRTTNLLNRDGSHVRRGNLHLPDTAMAHFRDIRARGYRARRADVNSANPGLPTPNTKS